VVKLWERTKKFGPIRNGATRVFSGGCDGMFYDAGSNGNGDD
jgi:hypothetical protein